MSDDGKTGLASALVVAAGVLWGLYWVPVRRLDAAGLTGAWGTLTAVAVAVLLLSPAAWRRRRALAAAPAASLLLIGLGGAAFVLYSVGLVYGRVAVIILLFYLTPVWSALIGRYLLGWRSRTVRVVAIALGLVGLAVMLGADGEAPVPRGLGEWFALAAGLLWAISSTGMRLNPGLDAMATSAVFCAGGAVSAILLVPFLGPLPTGLADSAGTLVVWSLAAGGLWWAVTVTFLLWAAARLEPVRVGILLMSEVLVGAVSGALLAGERLGAVELAGGALVLAAGLFELCAGRVRAAGPAPAGREG